MCVTYFGTSDGSSKRDLEVCVWERNTGASNQESLALSSWEHIKERKYNVQWRWQDGRKRTMKTNLELSLSLSWISHIPNNPVLGDWLIQMVRYSLWSYGFIKEVFSLKGNWTFPPRQGISLFLPSFDSSSSSRHFRNGWTHSFSLDF